MQKKAEAVQLEADLILEEACSTGEGGGEGPEAKGSWSLTRRSLSRRMTALGDTEEVSWEEKAAAVKVSKAAALRRRGEGHTATIQVTHSQRPRFASKGL